MKEIESGDILPAREAIALLESGDVDLSPPIEVPPIPPDVHPENISGEEREFLKAEIARLKKERHALVLAHNYMPPDVQDVADVVGDSLLLAQKGRDSDADILCEASVRFMQEILAVMKKSHQMVLAPDLGALCSLAAHAKVEKIRAWKAEHPDGIVVSYVNTYLDVKAESDYCCASANSPQVIKYVFANHDGPVAFGPDTYLGLYAAKMLEKIGHSIDRLYLMMGACHVHAMIRPYHVDMQRQKYPHAAVVVHPECGCTSRCLQQVETGMVSQEMLQFRSTQGMIKYVKESPQMEIIMATEAGNAYPISKAVPDKVIIPANPEAVCAYMKQNTLRRVQESLRDLKYEITVDQELAKRAYLPIKRMLEIV